MLNHKYTQLLQVHEGGLDLGLDFMHIFQWLGPACFGLVLCGYLLLVFASLVDSNDAVDCLVGLVSELTYYMARGHWISAHTLTDSFQSCRGRRVTTSQSLCMASS